MTVTVLCHHCGSTFEAEDHKVDVNNGCQNLFCIERRTKK